MPKLVEVTTKGEDVTLKRAPLMSKSGVMGEGIGVEKMLSKQTDDQSIIVEEKEEGLW